MSCFGREGEIQGIEEDEIGAIHYNGDGSGLLVMGKREAIRLCMLSYVLSYIYMATFFPTPTHLHKRIHLSTVQFASGRSLSLPCRYCVKDALLFRTTRKERSTERDGTRILRYFPRRQSDSHRRKL